MIAPLILALAAIAPVEAQVHDPHRGDWQQVVVHIAVDLAGPPQMGPPPGPPHDPRRGGDWQQAYDGRRDGSLLPLREIERRVVPTMAGAQYLGVEMDSPPVYTLKFLRDGHVIWVDVDGRSGQIIRRTGR